MTGLAAGVSTGFPVFEAASSPGGICSSYYMAPGDPRRWIDGAEGRYRFEYGGGHWIFGGDPEVLAFIERYAALRSYRRMSSVFFPDTASYVPYPLQYHLAHLDDMTGRQAFSDLEHKRTGPIETMADWVRGQFGDTLNALFFAPFHERYTAGLWTKIRPQDNYKTPLDLDLVRMGFQTQTPAAGYNATFVYPKEGLDRLARNMAEKCDVRYGRRAVRIDPERRTVYFDDGSTHAYDQLYATAPLNEVMNMTGLKAGSRPDPHTSVLVLNIGAKKGPACPDDHWIYVPASASGFHRVGFYSNVDPHFVPHEDPARVSLYIEKAFLPSERPSTVDIDRYSKDVVRELTDWGMIGAVEVLDPTWIDVAYTWSWPGSTWIEESLEMLAAHGITMLGRYGRWHFQGIAASILEGLGLKDS